MLALTIKNSWDPNHAKCPKIDDYIYYFRDLMDYYLITILILILLIVILHKKLISKNHKYNLNK
jgi:hypothetical protein